ncbi:MAG: cysteine desulfuration protein SufE [Sphingomonadales bacterium]|jgi:cysteine desulfuration protein SufE|nr:cysteine desulfuration protein SufE [Sphingomonadales bacterium]
MALPRNLEEIEGEFRLYDELSEDPRAERNSLVIDLGRALEPMPEALKTDETQVTGCASRVWVYPVPGSSKDQLLFYADSNSGLTKGIIAIILMIVQGKTAREVLATDIEGELEPLGLQKHFSSLRTSGLKNMIVKIRETAERLAS